MSSRWRRRLARLAVCILALVAVLPAVQLVGEVRSFFGAPPPRAAPPAGAEWINPYAGSEGEWLLANLHCHSSRYEGTLSANALAAEYRRRGYDVLAIQDHQLITDVTEVPLGLLILRGYEHGANISKVHFGVLEPTDYHWDWLPLRQTESQLRWISALLSHGAGFLQLNHPACRYPSPITADAVIGMPGLDALELTGSWGCSNPDFGALALWDDLWSRGRRLWVTGSDDSHAPPTIGTASTLVYARRDKASVLAALRSGRTIAVHRTPQETHLSPEYVTWNDSGLTIAFALPADRIAVLGPGREIFAQAFDVNRLSVPRKTLEMLLYFRIEYQRAGARYYLNPLYRGQSSPLRAGAPRQKHGS